MGEIDVELHTLADYLTSRRAAILKAWRNAIKRDPALMTGESLPRQQLFDHIPAMLATFERELRNSPAGATIVVNSVKDVGMTFRILFPREYAN